MLNSHNRITDRAYDALLERYGDDRTVFAAADGAGNLRRLAKRHGIDPDCDLQALRR